MALKMIVDSLDGVPEALHGEYTEKDGKFVLSVDGIEDTGGLKSALAAERTRAKDLEKKVKRWEALGKSDEEIQAMLEAQQQHEQTEAERKGEWDKLRAQMNEKHQKELGAKDDAVSKMRGTLEKHLIDAQATAAIAAAGGKVKPILNEVQKHVKVVEENGEFIAQVVDAKGDPRVNGKGEPLSINDLILELREDPEWQGNFAGSGTTGSGKPPGGSPSGGAGAKRKSDFKTEKERAAFVDANGFPAYQALPD